MSIDVCSLGRLPDADYPQSAGQLAVLPGDQGTLKCAHSLG